MVCPPLFEERKAAARPLVELAQHLALLGLPVLRFDYAGCGDSEGDLREVTPGDWEQDACAAVSEMHRRLPDSPPVLFGLRFGAWPALRAARTLAPRALVLWEPVVRGEDMLDSEMRRSLMKEMVTLGKARHRRDDLHTALAQGHTVDLGGYIVTPDQARAFHDIDLCHETIPASTPALLVSIGRSRSATRRPDPLAAWCEGAANVTRQSMPLPPFWNQVGLHDCSALVHATGEWLRGALGMAGSERGGLA